MLDHPHILPLFDYGEENIKGTSLTYMVMPYRVEGSLSTWLQQRSGSQLISPQEVAHYIRQAAAALSFAHNHQIIHQDVKPSNFLIRNNADNQDRPDLLLADFGVAKNRRNITGISYCQRRQNGSNIWSKYSFSPLCSRLSRNPGTYQTPGLIERQKHAISWLGSTCCTC
jgi:serine/threonine protein kinase